jgi:hypothetical protein
VNISPSSSADRRNSRSRMEWRKRSVGNMGK